MKDIINDYEWIDPEKILIDNDLMTLYYRHIGFIENELIINFNRVFNKCDYDLRLKNKHIWINGTEQIINPRERANNKRLPAKSFNGLTYLIPVTGRGEVNFKVELEITKDRSKIIKTKIKLEVDYYPVDKDYKIVNIEVLHEQA
ncbi:MAG: hypothetical protein E6X95_13130 [Thomasclavelia ramosa]|nr:hypothetical protein [Thomasclavelia ramosa]